MIKKIIDFFTITEKAMWQHIVFVALIIPFVILIFEKIKKWYILTRPINQLLKGYKNSNSETLLYVSQLSAATGAGPTLQKSPNQQYLISYPSPLPTNRQNLASVGRQNIDPVWSEADGQCAADVFNIFGRINKFQNLKIANIIGDWDKRGHPVFTVGFNPKTMDIITECNPVNFSGLNQNRLKIDGHNVELDSAYPQDAGIVQKTFIRGTAIPVFILAGLGTTGTESAGYFLRQSCVDLGKLYGNKQFCVLLRTDITKGKNYYEVKGLYPCPDLKSIVFHPFNYYKWNKKKVFPKK